MKVTVATRHFSQDIAELFGSRADVEILPRNYREADGHETDILVFAGGEDINPKRYGSDYRTYFSQERDDWEFQVLEDTLGDGKIRAKSIFGICRGLQLLNVFLGGSLVTDIETFYGAPHGVGHSLQHLRTSSSSPRTSEFSFLKVVNSLHHQSARNTPNRSKVLAVEPASGVPEIILFRKNVLGVQFHPELMPEDNEDKNRIADLLVEWSRGRSIVPTGGKQESKLQEALMRYSGEFYNMPDELRETGQIRGARISTNPANTISSNGEEG